MIRGFIIKRSCFQLAHTQEFLFAFFENGKIGHFDFGRIWGYYFESCRNRHKSSHVVSIYYPALFCVHAGTNPVETITVHFHKADLGLACICLLCTFLKIYLLSRSVRNYCLTWSIYSWLEKAEFLLLLLQAITSGLALPGLNCGISAITYYRDQLRATLPPQVALGMHNPSTVPFTEGTGNLFYVLMDGRNHLKQFGTSSTHRAVIALSLGKGLQRRGSRDLLTD